VAFNHVIGTSFAKSCSASFNLSTIVSGGTSRTRDCRKGGPAGPRFRAVLVDELRGEQEDGVAVGRHVRLNFHANLANDLGRDLHRVAHRLVLEAEAAEVEIKVEAISSTSSLPPSPFTMSLPRNCLYSYTGALGWREWQLVLDLGHGGLLFGQFGGCP
jgi:hypothetical protein